VPRPGLCKRQGLCVGPASASLCAVVSKATSFFALGLFCGVVLAGAWFARLGQKESAGGGSAEGRILKIAHSLPTSHPVHRGLEELQRRVNERSGGRLQIDIFPNEQLGNETQCLEKVQAGTLDITKTSAAPIGNFVPAFKVFSLPYLFRDREHYWQVLDGPVGQEMLEVLGKKEDGNSSDLHGLGYFDSGSRSFYTVDPVGSPSELAGKKIRVMNDQVAMAMVKAMGGSPTPISFGELYTALKQGTVDGAENNPPSFVSSRHYEICKNYVLDHHARIPDVILMSSKVWETLSPDERDWLKGAVADASKFQREVWAEETENCMKTLREAGVNIVEPDLAPFRAAAAPVLREYAKGVTGPLVEKIQAVK
jgi:tripartite ATP-independent transporter DctP family solute receptor